MIIGTFSRRTRSVVLIGLLPATLLVADALAHPVVEDDRALPAAAGTSQGDPGTAATLASKHSLPVDLAPQSFPVSMPDDGRFLSPTDTLPEIDSESSLRLLEQQGQLPIDVRSALPGDKEVAPLPTGRRPAAKRGTQQDLASSPPRPAGSAHEAIPLAGEEIAAVMRDLEESVVEAIVAATDAQIGPEGRGSFSLFGVEGFHFAAKGGQVSVGHGDQSLSVIEHAGSRDGEQTRQTIQHGPQQLSTPREPDGEWTIRQFILEIVEIVQYPLFWVVILMLLIGKIALTIASRRGRRRTHRRHSRSSQKVKVRRTRKRVRIRLKRPPSPVGLQEP